MNLEFKKLPTTKQLISRIDKIKGPEFGRPKLVLALINTLLDVFPMEAPALLEDEEVIFKLATTVGSDHSAWVKLTPKIKTRLSKQLLKTPELALRILNQVPYFFCHLSPTLRANRELVMAAVADDKRMLRFADAKLRSDSAVLSACRREYWLAVAELRYTREFTQAINKKNHAIHVITGCRGGGVDYYGAKKPVVGKNMTITQDDLGDQQFNHIDDWIAIGNNIPMEMKDPLEKLSSRFERGNIDIDTLKKRLRALGWAEAGETIEIEEMLSIKEL